MDEEKGYHVPIMADEITDALKVESGGVYFDGTLGGGGHSERILSAGGTLIAVDRDGEAIDYAARRFNMHPEFLGRYTLIQDNFKNVKEITSRLETDKLSGAVLDLGISSHQVDDSQRGFSYRYDSELDMRMDRNQILSALSVVNEYSEEQLSRIIFTYGEERFARRIAGAVVKARRQQPIETTGQLVELIKKCVPAGLKGGHPAKKTFQALRIEVNNELSGLGEAVSDIVDLLIPGGRLCVLTFHSLEDRIVKQTFKTLATDCICDKSLPVCVCGHKANIKLINKGERPSSRETELNPRSRSATLRIAEKL